MERRAEALFRFDPGKHLYFDLRGGLIPHITQMLKDGEWVDDIWFTEEGSIRGQAVHDLTSDFDLDALDAENVVSRYKSWLDGYVHAMQKLRPTWWMVEEPIVHPVYRFGGRPDNIGLLLGKQTVLEKKTGAKKRVTVRGLTLDPVGIQLALQAILAASRFPLPAEHWDRRAIYLKESGKYSIEHYTDERDFDEAWRLIRVYGGKVDGEAESSTETALPTAGGPRKRAPRPAVSHRRGRDFNGAAAVAVRAAGRAARSSRVNA